jgi:hypothetical protein
MRAPLAASITVAPLRGAAPSASAHTAALVDIGDIQSITFNTSTRG